MKKKIYKKIGQLIMPAIRFDRNLKKYSFEYIKNLCSEYNLSGFIIFQSEKKILKKYLSNLQREFHYNLLIASDLEYGAAQQIANTNLIPKQSAICSADDLFSAQKAAQIIASEAAFIGINTIFSPVSDINTNKNNPVINVRSFSDNKYKVVNFSKIYLNEYKKHNLISCIKHFPGHGDVFIDSHLSIPVINKNYNQLLKQELFPFIKLKNFTDSIMLGHLFLPKIDKQNLSSFSKKIIQDILIKRIKFKGLIFTDALNMKAVKDNYSLEHICINFINSGGNIILMPESIKKTIELIYKNILDKKINIDIFENTVKKIEKFKNNKLKKFYNSREKLFVNFSNNKKLSQKIFNSTISLIKGKAIIPNLKNKKILILCFDDDNIKNIENQFLNEIKKKKIKFDFLKMSKGRENISKILTKMKNYDFFIVLIFSKIKAFKGRIINKKLLHTINKLNSYKKFDIIINFSSPYIIENFKGNRILINAYSDFKESQIAAAAALTKNKFNFNSPFKLDIK